MLGNAVESFKGLKKLVNTLEHICMGLQILVVLFIFLSAAHIVLGICNCHILDSWNPLFESLKNFTVILFGDSIKQNQDGIDGREVLFILFSMLIAFVLVQIKTILNAMSKDFTKKIEEEKNKIERAVNKELQKDLKVKTLAQSCFMLAVQLKVKWIARDALTSNRVPTEEEVQKVKLEVINAFYSKMNCISDLKFMKDDDVLVISSNKFNNVDTIITEALKSIEELKIQYKEQKYAIRARLLIDSYRPFDKVSVIYKNIAPLFTLSANNEILCYGNFRARYLHMKDVQYYVSIKGKYDKLGGDDSTVYYLVKKN